jgi:O-antigen/teichoic acid export membrane protein
MLPANINPRDFGFAFTGWDSTVTSHSERRFAIQARFLWQSLRQRIPPSSLGFLDQAMISASNFLLMAYLARQLGPTNFGTFSLTFLSLMVVGNIQASLVTQPHNVLGAALDEDEYASYTHSTTMGQLWLAGGISLVLGCAAASLIMMGNHHQGQLVLAFSALSFGWQMQEYFKRTFYTRLAYHKAIVADLLPYVGQVIAIVMLDYLGKLSVTSAMLGMATVFFGGALVGAVIGRSQIRPRGYLHTICGDIIANLRFGQWLLGAAIAYLIAGQLYPVLAAGFVSLAAMGGIRTAQNLVAPTNILNKTVSSIAPAQATLAYRSGGVRDLRAYMIRIGVPGTLGLSAFLLLVSIFAGPIITLLVGDEYREYAWLVTFLSLSYLLEFLATLGSVALRSLDEVRVIMIAECISAAIVLTAGTFAVWKFGLAGAAAGLLVHGIVVNLVLWWAVSNRFNQKSALLSGGPAQHVHQAL